MNLKSERVTVSVNFDGADADLASDTQWALGITEGKLTFGPEGELWKGMVVNNSDPLLTEVISMKWDQAGSGSVVAFMSTVWNEQPTYIQVVNGTVTSDRVAIADDGSVLPTFDQLVEEFSRPLPPDTATCQDPTTTA